MNAHVVVFGATGYTGRLVVESLVERGVRPVLAGRRERPLNQLACTLGGLDVRTADLAEPDSVRALVSEGDVLVTTVGPFERLGDVAADAAASQGAHYLDSTGEVGFVRRLQKRYPAAASDDAAAPGDAPRGTMLPAFGYDYVPGILAGSLALERAGDRAETLRVGYFAPGAGPTGLSGGTMTTMLEELSKPFLVWRDHRWQKPGRMPRQHTFTVDGAKRNAVMVPGTEIVFLPEAFPEVANIEVFNGWFSAPGPVMKAALPAMAVAGSSSLARKALGKGITALTGSEGGPSASERAKSSSLAIAVVTDSRGETVSEVRVAGPNVYTLTGHLLAAGAEHVLKDRSRARGVVGPLQAFGMEGLVELCASAGLWEVSSGAAR